MCSCGRKSKDMGIYSMIMNYMYVCFVKIQKLITYKNNIFNWYMYEYSLAYDGDVILLCPSRSGLQKMINICEQFGIDFQVTFNDKKTQCICLSKWNNTGCGPATLNNNGNQRWNHLGNILNQRLDVTYTTR